MSDDPKDTDPKVPPKTTIVVPQSVSFFNWNSVSRKVFIIEFRMYVCFRRLVVVSPLPELRPPKAPGPHNLRQEDVNPKPVLALDLLSVRRRPLM